MKPRSVFPKGVAIGVGIALVLSLAIGPLTRIMHEEALSP